MPEMRVIGAGIGRTGTHSLKIALEQLISGFAVSSESTRQANLKAARRKYATSSNYKEQKVAEAEEIREHAPQYFEKKKKK